MMESLVNLAGPVMGFDGWQEGRGIAELGIEGMELDALKRRGYFNSTHFFVWVKAAAVSR